MVWAMDELVQTRSKHSSLSWSEWTDYTRDRTADWMWEGLHKSDRKQKITISLNGSKYQWRVKP